MSSDKNFFNNNKNLTKKYLLKNCSIIDPSKNKIIVSDILIKNKLIDKIAKQISHTKNENIEVIDCKGKYVSAGFVDMRVKINEPGQEHKETLESASMAAASGGVTSLICILILTLRLINRLLFIAFKDEREKLRSQSKIFCTGCVTRNFEGKEICELHLMKESGAVGFTDGFKTISNARVMRRALKYVKSFDGLIIQHAEEPSLSLNCSVNEGATATRMGLIGMPSYAEPMIVERDIWMIRETLCRYHVSHISAKETVEIIRRAKKEGLPITCDTSPPYFTLNEMSLENYRTFSKLSPPLRTEEDRKYIIEGLGDGTIDAISSDHTPQDQDAKRLPFNQAEFGGVGLETLLPLTLNLVRNKEIDLIRAISLLSFNPSKILKLNVGIVEEKKEADLSIFDISKPWKVDPENFFGKSKNSPFDGMLVEGKI